MRLRPFFLASLFLLALSWPALAETTTANDANDGTADADAAAQPMTTPHRAEAPSSDLERADMDPSVSACTDFFRYANGTWLDEHPIPDDETHWGISSLMRERNFALLREILDDAAAGNHPEGSNARKVGDFWRTAMDVEAIEKAGAAPLADDLESIAGLSSPADLAAWIRQRQVEGRPYLFHMAVMQDLKDSERYMVYAVQGGLGLSDRDDYLREGEDAEKLRAKYVDHVARMLALLGDEEAAARSAAEEIMALETRLAVVSLTQVERRDPSSYYNPMAPAAVDETTEHFSWVAMMSDLGLAEDAPFSYAHTTFLDTVDQALGDVPLSTWKSYLRWHTVRDAAGYLSTPFVEANFDFYGRTLRGTESLQPRWKRMLRTTSGSLGEAVGQVYVERAFPPASKERAVAMIENLRLTIGERIRGLEWMGEETKAQALRKLGTFVAKVGYPDSWRDYSDLQVGTESLLANQRAAVAFEARRQFDKIGQSIDRTEWGMSPQTINAYYNPVQNEIVFPAAIMQPPLFDGGADDALNYGAMGSVIGHEFMHGFDDKGSRFDAEGNMQNWWTDEDRARFEERTDKLVAQYDGYTVGDGVAVNGKLTLGENIGDLAGLTMAYHAHQRALAAGGEDARRSIGGFTPEQRFFLAYARAWRRNVRDEAMVLQVRTDPHSPAHYRVLGPLANMPEFAQAFGCDADDPMVLPAAERAAIW